MKVFFYVQCILFSLHLFSQESKFIQNKEDLIHYKTFGKGKPLLIINGGPGMNCEGFSKLAEDISKFGFQTIIYDQRGTGKSLLKKIDSTTVTIETMVADIEKIRTHLKIKKWSLFGQSFGGILATKYIEKYPTKIEKVIFSSSAGVNLNFLNYLNQSLSRNLTKTENDSLSFYTNKLDENENNIYIIKKRAQFLANAYVYNKTFSSQIAERLTQINYKINRLVIDNLIQTNYNLQNKFQNFKKPVLILQGKNDIITIETAKEIKTTFKNSTLILMNNCSHYGWLDQRELFFNSVKDFLSK